jgi:hypothetical protein
VAARGAVEIYHHTSCGGGGSKHEYVMVLSQQQETICFHKNLMVKSQPIVAMMLVLFRVSITSVR